MPAFSLKRDAAVRLATTLCLSTLTAASAEPVIELDAFTVSAGPTARAIEDFAIPVSALDAEALQRIVGSTLGELLDGQLGVSATGFGAGASRPIIRGFDGPRVRILDSGIEALDVSDTSPDHAVAVEPLLVERIEILRGPSTLLYGSSAIGGVVNVIGREIPRTPPALDGLSGTAEVSYDTAAAGKKALASTTVGNAGWSLRVTGLTHDREDYAIPGEAELEAEEHEENEEHEEHGGELENSFLESNAYSVGGTRFFGAGSYFGLAYSRYSSLYGVPGHVHAHGHDEEHDHDDDHDDDHHDDDHHGVDDHEEEEEASVSIDLVRERLHFELLLAEPSDWIEAARVRFGYTDYAHTELEGDEIGTVFGKDGWELRGEIAHRALGFVDEGVMGIQISDTQFVAAGEEAFTPPADVRTQAVFVSQHIHGHRLHGDFGARLEEQRVSPEGIDARYADLALSLAASAIWNLSETQSVTLSLQRSQRHPTSTELYADGPHLATTQYEIGDATLGRETALGLDLNYRYDAGAWRGTLSTFHTAFDDYIFAYATGAEEDGLPVYQFVAVDATFSGFEAEIEYTAYRVGDTALSYRLTVDYVSAVNDTTGEELPRIPPLRLGGGVRFETGAWKLGADLRHSFEQDQTAPGETETGGYTQLSFDFAYRLAVRGRHELTLSVKGSNLLDEEIRPHTSFLKAVAPLPGRSFVVGLRYGF